MSSVRLSSPSLQDCETSGERSDSTPNKRDDKKVAFAFVSSSTTDSGGLSSSDEDRETGKERRSLFPGNRTHRRRSSTALLGAERVLRTRERLWSTALSALVASIPSLLVGYTIGYASSAILDLTGRGTAHLPKDYRFSPRQSELFAVSCRGRESVATQ